MRFIAALLLSITLFSCASMQKFDECQAFAIATETHKVANGASNIVCMALKGEKRKKCLEQRKKAAAAAATEPESSE